MAPVRLAQGMGMPGLSSIFVRLAALALVAGVSLPAAAAEQMTVPPVPPKAKAKPKPNPPAEDAPQCAWTGTHVITLLAREDVVAAGEYLRFYQTFKCPEPHLAEALGCVISAQAQSDEPARELVERAKLCWNNPSMKFLEAPAGEAPKAGEAAKPGEPAKPATQ